MILYNITTKVDHDTHAGWLKWMQQVYIPQIMEDGYFEEYRLSRLLGVDESDGLTYALQLGMANMTTFRLYQQKKALAHQTMHDTRFGEKALSFRSVLNVIDKG
ncbi:MAG: DUF4286 family protein [Bacteroidota bacterium]